MTFWLLRLHWTIFFHSRSTGTLLPIEKWIIRPLHSFNLTHTISVIKSLKISAHSLLDKNRAREESASHKTDGSWMKKSSVFHEHCREIQAAGKFNSSKYVRKPEVTTGSWHLITSHFLIHSRIWTFNRMFFFLLKKPRRKNRRCLWQWTVTIQLINRKSMKIYYFHFNKYIFNVIFTAFM